MRHLMAVLKALIDDAIAPVLVEEDAGAAAGGFSAAERALKQQQNKRSLRDLWDGGRQAELARELKALTEDLLNAAFDASSGYVRVTDPDSLAVQFLVRADVVEIKPADARYVRLRDYSKKF
ncbi:uncharacterized protein V1510DRAFT_422968 [Dipodascopsis tothii]|uniref:uncharacterized protein n=1 Tax=Dipodascopsis tothii TaxID=44089 RepID=UPI0034CFAD51